MTRQILQDNNLTRLAEKAVDVLRTGNAIIFPTDTLYALGVDALNVDAIERFFALKKRPSNKPVPIFVKDIKMAHDVAFIDKRQEEILEKLWPGPFTCVLYKKNKISSRLVAGSQKIGLRIPNNKFCATFLEKFAGPITASSANISGMDSQDNIDEIIKQFKEYSITPDLIIDAGGLDNINSSTVIDITGKEPKILRINNSNVEKLKEVFNLLYYNKQ